MLKKRSVEVTAVIMLIGSVVLINYYGFKYFAGWQYASPHDRSIISFLDMLINVSLLYFVYRFLDWVVKKIRNLLISTK